MLSLVTSILIFSGIALTSAVAAAAISDTYNILEAPAIAKPGCLTRCGNQLVPYPFGIGPGCGIGEWFDLTCTASEEYLPRLLLGNTQVYDISDHRIRVSNNAIARKCYSETASYQYGQYNVTYNITGSPFSYSDLNKFTVIGCDDTALITARNLTTTTTCNSTCWTVTGVEDAGDCLGRGCCQAPVLKGHQYFFAELGSFENHSGVTPFNPCGSAFLGEQGRFVFRVSDMWDQAFELRVQKAVPVVLDWSIGKLSCAQARSDPSYACKGNSYCVDSDGGLGGYRCSCSQGYRGNPYLYHGCNARRSHFPLLKVALGAGFGFSYILIGATWLYFYIKKRQLRKLREKFFRRNGGYLLKQRISWKEGSVQPTKVFAVDELEAATDGFADSRIIGQGGFGTVYKGTLRPDNHVVAIKKSRVMDESQIEQFINEVVILTQINHRNVVKLLGCCLESAVPLLVYEYVSHGTVYEQIHRSGRAAANWLSWEERLRIASEAAGALAYLHSAASIPIIHRDVKSTNILLDEHHTAKISDFGASRLIPLDKTRVTTKVVGTFGYIDPEYFLTNQLTEKSDVYSFGVVLAELLTGRKPVDMGRSEEQHGLILYFIRSMQENRLFQILEPRVMREGSREQIQTTADLINRCTRSNREDRPTMRDVAMELEALRKLR